MSWTEEEIDELLVRYLDQELSSEEIEPLERLLATDPKVQRKLAAWKHLRAGFQELRRNSIKSNTLDAHFADRILLAAQARVKELGDPTLAPWISRTGSSQSVDAASRIRERESPSRIEGLKRRSIFRRWTLGLAASGLAASLLFIAFWMSQPPKSETLLSGSHRPSSVDQPSGSAETSEAIVLHDAKTFPVKPDATRELQVDQVISETIANLPSPVVVSPAPAQADAKTSQDLPGPADLAKSADNRETDLRSKEAASSVVGADLKPSADQLKAIEAMMKDPNGTFLFVVDIGLPDDVTDVLALRQILDRHDIAWASELEIDESMQKSLAKSRMISEAGKQGLIPDFIDPNASPARPESDGLETEQSVSLVFVKARAARLDAAIIEVMQQTDDFPTFSFDLAFDPPTHALMNELRFIQEASLPSLNIPSSKDISNLIRPSRSNARQDSLEYFAAGPRRSKEMSLETRRSSRLPLDLETMNPVSYALFIMRHAKPESAK